MRGRCGIPVHGAALSSMHSIAPAAGKLIDYLLCDGRPASVSGFGEGRGGAFILELLASLLAFAACWPV